MGLVDLLGIADLDCRKFEITKWLKHKLTATLGGQYFEQTDGRSGFSFPLSFSGDGWNLSHKPLGIFRSSLALG